MLFSAARVSHEYRHDRAQVEAPTNKPVAIARALGASIRSRSVATNGDRLYRSPKSADNFGDKFVRKRATANRNAHRTRYSAGRRHAGLFLTDYCEIAATAARLRRPHNKPIRAIARPQWCGLTK